MKSSVEEIRQRFDNDVERFSNESTGQTSTVDSDLVLGIIEKSISGIHYDAKTICDIGCGAGNFTVRILKQIPGLSCTLIDLSKPMLTKAASRVEKNSGRVEGIHQQDIRSIDLPNNHFDIVVAAAVLHHLRTKDEWTNVLKNIYQSLKPGGTLWIWDLIKYDNTEIEKVQNERYGRYLTALKDEAYKEQVFDYIEKEDSPESSAFILQNMYGVGFNEVDVIHKNVKFCAIYGRK